MSSGIILLEYNVFSSIYISFLCIKIVSLLVLWVANIFLEFLYLLILFILFNLQSWIKNFGLKNPTCFLAMLELWTVELF